MRTPGGEAQGNADLDGAPRHVPPPASHPPARWRPWHLEGRVVLVTGAAGGVGSALVAALSDAGAVVAALDRVDAMPPRSASRWVADLREVEALPGLVRRIVERHGRLDAVIQNAGLTVHGAFADLTGAQIDEVLDVDLRAVLHLTRATLPALREARGQVVIVSSMAGLVGFPSEAVYSASKWALIGFSRALRIELAPRGVGVHTILPGTIATPFLRNAATTDPETAARLASLMQRWGTKPARVARATLRAMRRRRDEVLVGWDARLVAWTVALAPPLLPWLLRRAYRRSLR